VKNVLHVGGFVMERPMLTGIKARAEGRQPFLPNEPFEFGLWALALLAGLVSA